ncbi:glycosyltransferase family 2 protein [Panacibacter ginsenosidivorans]|uniref:Glycosyltransferase family 2 protein n=1 Tax=Panacibacter ginsenosidivorans TaxID=1813871 RepID=A0A5B8VF07_9BACT|nr:glycosyltransferase family A protein [Panacibacter ginsenosidivorans]QEC69096.1 glycosyltransferase family 2 protein [Panacibacter ginsenosidivorans]
MPKHATGFAACYIAPEELTPELEDKAYETLQAKLTDAGFRLCNRGTLISSTKEDVAKVLSLPPISLKDEYVFIRKYWGTAWAMYAFLLRILSFHNWFKESSAFFATKHIKKVNLFADPVNYPLYESFDSKLITEQPLIAVIIPTLNRYQYLKDVLHDLEKQHYKNFEVIVVDQSDNFDEKFYQQFSLRIQLIRQQEKKLWTARNNAIKHTKAALLLFFDDDSRVEPDWITEHVKCIDFFNAEISAGVSLAVTGQKISDSYNYFRWATQFDSGNAMVKRSVFATTGLFDEQFNGMRMGDAEFGYRAYNHGFNSISNHKAPRVHLKVKEGGLREMGSWDGFRPTKWFAPKPVPSVLYLLKKYFSQSFYKNAVLLGIMLSNVSYKQKRSSNMLMLSVVLTVIKSPLLYMQYRRSLHIAKQMLHNNYQPELLNE